MNSLHFTRMMVLQDLTHWIRTSFFPAVWTFVFWTKQWEFFNEYIFIINHGCNRSYIDFFLTSADVPEGSFIIRAHTPMSNLFSCLWFNEVERFTPRDQLSFAYTYQKLRRMNPEKPFRLNMFKVNLCGIFLTAYKWELIGEIRLK